MKVRDYLRFFLNEFNIQDDFKITQRVENKNFFDAHNEKQEIWLRFDSIYIFITVVGKNDLFDDFTGNYFMTIADKKIKRILCG